MVGTRTGSFLRPSPSKASSRAVVPEVTATASVVPASDSCLEPRGARAEGQGSRARNLLAPGDELADDGLAEPERERWHRRLRKSRSREIPGLHGAARGNHADSPGETAAPGNACRTVIALAVSGHGQTSGGVGIVRPLAPGLGCARCLASVTLHDAVLADCAVQQLDGGGCPMGRTEASRNGRIAPCQGERGVARLGAMTTGDRIAALRRERGWSQSQLAAALTAVSGRVVAREEVSRWEHRRRTPTPYWLSLIAGALGVPPAGLRPLGRREPPDGPATCSPKRWTG